MIVLDTNVVAEAMRARPDATVRAWLNEQAPETLHLSSVTLAELLFAIQCMPAGKRKTALAGALEDVLALFKGRILPFDQDAAGHYAALAAKARSQGRGFPTPDGYIAAVAVSRGFTVASRDIAPLRAAGVPLINPWEA